jgi:hypothetical protein
MVFSVICWFFCHPILGQENVYGFLNEYNIPMTDPWCWYICEQKGGIWMVNVTIYSIHGSYGIIYVFLMLDDPYYPYPLWTFMDLPSRKFSECSRKWNPHVPPKDWFNPIHLDHGKSNTLQPI